MEGVNFRQSHANVSPALPLGAIIRNGIWAMISTLGRDLEISTLVAVFDIDALHVSSNIRVALTVSGLISVGAHIGQNKDMPTSKDPASDGYGRITPRILPSLLVFRLPGPLGTTVYTASARTLDEHRAFIVLWYGSLPRLETLSAAALSTADDTHCL
ncbi:uncharacterized protein N7482_005564 [Penicillium canariense]|uniref:Uncharacterized protein n=1 Tax=Penicillium canariense TaxID=189055 RepID=A0A9W9I4W5_9EURO|nr:uncharacterized protein N7482_005564 [Penicillium canariense]KAJ5166783.1 hypothetical protein N7482_005564 [Penicillium canariense]